MSLALYHPHHHCHSTLSTTPTSTKPISLGYNLNALHNSQYRESEITFPANQAADQLITTFHNINTSQPKRDIQLVIPYAILTTCPGNVNTSATKRKPNSSRLRTPDASWLT